MEIRSFDIRSSDSPEGIIEAIAAPLDSAYERDGFTEKYGVGVFDDFDSERSYPLYAEHDHRNGGMPIGTIFEGRNTDKGFEIKAKLADTAKAKEVRTLIDSGAYRSVSAGFQPTDGEFDEDTNTLTITRANMLEVSVTGIPAYQSAGITSMRSAWNQELPVEDGVSVRSDDKSNERGSTENTSITNMTENIEFASAADLAEVRSNQEALDKVVSDLKAGNKPAVVTETSAFRSAGEAVKGLLDTDGKAQGEFRVLATTANSHAANDWKGILVGIAQANRVLTNVFGVGPLNPTGNTVEYGNYTVTGAAGSQAAQGDVLGDLYITAGSANTPVRTFGVKSELSRQVIERSDISFLDDTLKAQAGSYATQTNAYVRSILTGASATAGAGFTLSSATSKQVLTAVIDGLQKIDALNLGWTADAVVVSLDVFLAIATLSDSSNRPILDVNKDGANTVGTANGLSANIYGVPVIVDNGLAVKSMYVVSKNAINVWENAGAPVALSDQNILNLTQQFSLYGYLASGVVAANAIVKPAIA